MTRYRTIAADPNWLERGGGKSKRGADRHYALQTTDEIIDVMATALGMGPGLPFGTSWPQRAPWKHGPRSKVADSAHLWLWCTDNFMCNGDGLSVMRALCFRPVRSWVWVKLDVDENGAIIVSGDDRAYPADSLQIGLGQYGRNAHEWLLFGVRGATHLPPTDMRWPSVIFAPKTKHSEKPAVFYDLMEDTSPGPRLEMYARGPRKGWDVWGDECGGAS